MITKGHAGAEPSRYLVNGTAGHCATFDHTFHQLSLADCTFAPEQRWTQLAHQDTQNTYYQFVNEASGMCLVSHPEKRPVGTPIGLYPRTKDPRQDWLLVYLGAGGYRLVSRVTGLAAAAADRYGGVIVSQFPASTVAQSWTLFDGASG
jgi:hypothetical protein